MQSLRRKNEMGIMYIFFVSFFIFGNLIEYTVSEISGSSVLYRIISSVQVLIACAVYGFVFMEGYALQSRKKTTFHTFLLRLKKLLFPFAITVAVYWLARAILGDAGLKPVALLKTSLKYHFYVIYVILQFYIFSMFTDKIAKSWTPAVMLFVSLAITLLSVTLLPAKIYRYSFTTYLLCYVVGYLAGVNKEKLHLKSETNFNSIVFVFVVSLIVAESISIIYAFSGNRYALMLTRAVSALYNPVACVFVVSVCTKLAHCRICNTSFFENLYKSTYSIYLWHMLPIISVNLLLLEREEMQKLGSFAIKLFLTLIVILIVVLLKGRKRGIKNGTI